MLSALCIFMSSFPRAHCEIVLIFRSTEKKWNNSAGNGIDLSVKSLQLFLSWRHKKRNSWLFFFNAGKWRPVCDSKNAVNVGSSSESAFMLCMWECRTRIITKLRIFSDFQMCSLVCVNSYNWILVLGNLFDAKGCVWQPELVSLESHKGRPSRIYNANVQII